MYQYKGLEDTIAAISTANGQGGIGVVRISGDKASDISVEIFKPFKKKDMRQVRSHTVHYGWIVDPKTKEKVDEVLLTIMRGPHSYTKEDIVEISCHGGAVSVKSILDLICSCGARLAEPGEFTKRAFVNGRIDLTQAEAVLDIIQSKTDAFLRVSTNQLKGELSTELEAIREMLMKIYVECEAVVNFPEDDIDSQGKAKVQQDLMVVKNRVKKLLETSDQGRILREGVKVVLCGRPNVGKSSLLNILLKSPRAIVSDIEGTTRDTIEETTQINGIPMQIVDTAGILEPRDAIEQEAVQRSQMNIQSADVILFLLDASEDLMSTDLQLMEQIKDYNVVVVLNKIDLEEKITLDTLQNQLSHKKVLRVSTLKNLGIDELRNAVASSVGQSDTSSIQSLMLSNSRHIHSLRETDESLQKALTELEQGISLEFTSEDIKSAVNSLDSITGRNIDMDLLDTIFSEFCIGK